MSTIAMPHSLVTPNRKQYEERAREAFARGEDVTFDFASCVYVDSSSLGMLVSLKRAATREGRTFGCAHLYGDLAHLFRLTKMDTLFPVEEAA